MVQLTREVDEAPILGDGRLDSLVVTAIEAVDLYQALDNWLASGGFQPDWSRDKTGAGR